MAQDLSLKQFCVELIEGFKKWSGQGQPPIAALPAFISYIMDQHEYQRVLCTHVLSDVEMVKLGNTGVPAQHRKHAQAVTAGRLSEAQMFLHSLEIHLMCARRVNAYFVNTSSQNHDCIAEVAGLVHATTEGYSYFEGKRHLITETWAEIFQLCDRYGSSGSDSRANTDVDG
ncbi:hypothetical protein MMC18_000536 [Xylographa bjoerkii]|nr:hypothetical protein [Xylographa bjoerkii]